MGNIHVKLNEIWASGSGDVYRKSLRTTDGQRPITIAHLEPSFFLILLARSNFDHYARECDLGILKKKKTKTKQKTKKSLFLIK